MVKKKGFTLIEAIIGIGLLGLISVTTLPIMTTSFINLKNHNIKMEMNYIGEVVIERIKAFDEESLDLYLYDIKISEIVEKFSLTNKTDFSKSINKDGEPFLIKLIKKNHSDKIWKIHVYIYHDKEGSNIGHVEYKIYIPKE